MSIVHRTVLGEDGKPVAALIPWEVFEMIQTHFEDDEFETTTAEWQKEIARRATEIDEGEVELVDGEEFLSRLKAI